MALLRVLARILRPKRVSEPALSRRDAKITQLYNQGPSKRRLALYLVRWFGWVGVCGPLKYILVISAINSSANIGHATDTTDQDPPPSPGAVCVHDAAVGCGIADFDDLPLDKLKCTGQAVQNNCLTLLTPAEKDCLKCVHQQFLTTCSNAPGGPAIAKCMHKACKGNCAAKCHGPEEEIDEQLEAGENDDDEDTDGDN